MLCIEMFQQVGGVYRDVTVGVIEIFQQVGVVYRDVSASGCCL